MSTISVFGAAPVVVPVISEAIFRAVVAALAGGVGDGSGKSRAPFNPAAKLRLIAVNAGVEQIKPRGIITAVTVKFSVKRQGW